jgi:hypothetical protein
MIPFARPRRSLYLRRVLTPRSHLSNIIWCAIMFGVHILYGSFHNGCNQWDAVVTKARSRWPNGPRTSSRGRHIRRMSLHAQGVVGVFYYVAIRAAAIIRLAAPMVSPLFRSVSMLASCNFATFEYPARSSNCS